MLEFNICRSNLVNFSILNKDIGIREKNAGKNKRKPTFIWHIPLTHGIQVKVAVNCKEF